MLRSSLLREHVSSFPYIRPRHVWHAWSREIPRAYSSDRKRTKMVLENGEKKNGERKSNREEMTGFIRVNIPFGRNIWLERWTTRNLPLNPFHFFAPRLMTVLVNHPTISNREFYHTYRYTDRCLYCFSIGSDVPFPCTVFSSRVARFITN